MPPTTGTHMGSNRSCRTKEDWKVIDGSSDDVSMNAVAANRSTGKQAKPD